LSSREWLFCWCAEVMDCYFQALFPSSVRYRMKDSMGLSFDQVLNAT
jgi:hypothetical protein